MATLTNLDYMKYSMSLVKKKSSSPHFSPSKSFAVITVTAMLHIIAVWAMTPLHDQEEDGGVKKRMRRMVTEIGRCKTADRYMV